MILMSVRFLANRHILLGIGDLREIRIRRQKRGFAPKWTSAITSLRPFLKRENLAWSQALLGRLSAAQALVALAEALPWAF